MVIQFNKTYPTKELFQFNVKCFKTMLHINTWESCYCNSKKKKKKDTHTTVQMLLLVLEKCPLNRDSFIPIIFVYNTTVSSCNPPQKYIETAVNFNK